MKKNERDDVCKEAYEEGWRAGFNACLIHLQEQLAEEIIKRHKQAQKPKTRWRI